MTGKLPPTNPSNTFLAALFLLALMGC